VFARKEPVVTERYRKDPEDERFLEEVNELLAPREESLYRELPERFPTVFIVGVPRSGTTLLSQLVSSLLPVGYVNNLIAAFWRAPVHGIRLSRKLLGDDRSTTYQSDLGRTKGIQEPHEFGYFWSWHLRSQEMLEPEPGHDREVDWPRIRTTLLNMAHAFAAPVVFKPMLVAWHMRSMQRCLSQAVFVRVRRHPVDNATSLMRVRRKFLGSYDEWFSMKPREYGWLKDEPPWRQVAGQVFHLERTMTRQLAHVRSLDVAYEEICRDPETAVARIAESLGGLRPLTRPPPAFPVRTASTGVPELDEKIARAVAEFYAE
jgi:hypothetical protein